MERVKDGEMELDKARAIAGLGAVLIDSAKAESDYLRVIADLPGDLQGTGFIREEGAQPDARRLGHHGGQVDNGGKKTCRGI